MLMFIRNIKKFPVVTLISRRFIISLMNISMQKITLKNYGKKAIEMKKCIRVVTASLALSLAFSFAAMAADKGASSAGSGAAAPSVSSGAKPGCRHCRQHGEIAALSKVTGISEDELLNKYPQQTAWQIAYKLNKLDSLKKEYLADKKEFLKMLVDENRITAEESSKIYADLQQRVSKIDGKDIVITGRPTYKPERKGPPPAPQR